MLKSTENWIKTSEYDIKTALAMLKAGRYIYVIFMCHLSLEKILKAIINEKIKKMPPKTHSLLYLVELTDMKLPEKYKDLVADLNLLSVPTRYPEDINKLSKQFDKKNTSDIYSKTKRLILWVKQNKKLIKQ